MEKEESPLSEMKKEYSKFQEKYKLPSFDELNEEFHIEKIADSETDFLLREIRKVISERLYGHMRNVETLLNPANASMFVFSIVKNIGTEDRKILQDIYKELAKNELQLIQVDLKYSEVSEANFIKNSFSLWKNISGRFIEIMEKVEKNWDNKIEGKSKGYFG